MEDTEKQTYTVYDIMKILGIGRNSAYNLVAKKSLALSKSAEPYVYQKVHSMTG